jgi:hypothetical protein
MEEMVRIGFPFPFPFAFLFASRLDPGIPDHRPESSGTAVNGTLNGRRDRAGGAGQRKP